MFVISKIEILKFTILENTVKCLAKLQSGFQNYV
jgi:hypothetical protein